MIPKRKYCFWAVCLLLSQLGCTQKKPDFDSIQKMDAHVHIRYSGAEFINQAIDDGFKVITITTDHHEISEQQKYIDEQRRQNPARLGYLASFTMQGWDRPGWQEKTISELKRAFGQGALGVKVWKNIGMEFKDKNGKFVMIDDPRFDPIIDFIESQNKTLTGHIGEPHDCWLPLDQMTATSNQRYFANNPQYHMYLHPEYPSYDDQIQSVFNMLTRHPNVRYVGCHLASMERNLRKLAQFLDAFPNIAVDLAARIDDIQYLDRMEVRDFFIRYQDRILYGTDMGIGKNNNPSDYIHRMHQIWLNDWKYFSSGSKAEISGGNKQVKGLDLPASVLQKMYYQNAVKWYPGI